MGQAAILLHTDMCKTFVFELLRLCKFWAWDTISILDQKKCLFPFHSCCRILHIKSFSPMMPRYVGVFLVVFSSGVTVNEHSWKQYIRIPPPWDRSLATSSKTDQGQHKLLYSYYWFLFQTPNKKLYEIEKLL